MNETHSHVILSGHIIVPDKDLGIVLAALPTHIELSLSEPGCLVFEVTQRPDNPTVFDVYEEFVDRSAFDNHQRRVRNSHWGRVTMDVERHYAIDQID